MLYTKDRAGQRQLFLGALRGEAAQVASHAQKYFIRLNSLNKKDKRRSSIHDITSPGGVTGDITGALCAR